jgi:hypothetical protein
MVPRNASHTRSRLPPPPPLLPLPEPLVLPVLFVPLVVGSLTVSPPPLEVLPLGGVPLDVPAPVVESEEVEVVGAATSLRHDAVATSALIWLRLHDENWLL